MYHPQQDVLVFHLFLFAVVIGLPTPLIVATLCALDPAGSVLPLIVLLGFVILVLELMTRYAKKIWKTSTRVAFRKVGALAGVYLLIGGFIAAVIGVGTYNLS